MQQREEQCSTQQPTLSELGGGECVTPFSGICSYTTTALYTTTIVTAQEQQSVQTTITFTTV